MCAAVGVKPLAVTLPLTLPSSLIVIDPLPELLPCTGGTSCCPESFTCIVSASATADTNASAAANDQHEILIAVLDLKNAFIFDPSWMVEAGAPKARVHRGDARHIG